MSTFHFQSLAGTQSYRDLLLTKKELRAVARWVMGEDLLHQFLFAKGHTEWAERGKYKGEEFEEAEEERILTKKTASRSNRNGAPSWRGYTDGIKFRKGYVTWGPQLRDRRNSGSD